MPAGDVNGDDLSRLLRSYGSELESLALYSCENLTPGLVAGIPRWCPLITTLDLVDINNCFKSSRAVLDMLEALHSNNSSCLSLRIGGRWMCDEVVYRLSQVLPELRYLHLVTARSFGTLNRCRVHRECLLAIMASGVWSDTNLLLDGCTADESPELSWVINHLQGGGARGDVTNAIGDEGCVPMAWWAFPFAAIAGVAAVWTNWM